MIITKKEAARRANPPFILSTYAGENSKMKTMEELSQVSKMKTLPIYTIRRNNLPSDIYIFISTADLLEFLGAKRGHQNHIRLLAVMQKLDFTPHVFSRREDRAFKRGYACPIAFFKSELFESDLKHFWGNRHAIYYGFKYGENKEEK